MKQKRILITSLVAAATLCIPFAAFAASEETIPSTTPATAATASSKVPMPATVTPTSFSAKTIPAAARRI